MENGKKLYHQIKVNSLKIYRKEIRSGIIAVLLINSAVINIIDSSKPKNKKEKTVISYEKLLSMYQLKDPSLD